MLHGLVVIEGLAVLAFVYAALPSFIAVFLSALITGIVLDTVADRAYFNNEKYLLRAFAITVFITIIQQGAALANIALLPWLQYVAIAAIAYLLWDGLIGQALKAGQEDALRAAHG
ncbi:MAG: hypothetical protein HY429_01135 [Candidatus Levybacteria bacterium]|nr:hypothetical protein [Candidatus Levybacteria bacterium]